MKPEVFFEKVSERKLDALRRIAIVSDVELKHRPSLSPEYEFSKYEGMTEKDYFFFDEVDFSEDITYCFRFELGEYGYRVENEDDLYPAKDDMGTGEFKLQVGAFDRRRRTCEIRGSLHGSTFDINGEFVDPELNYKITGVSAEQKIKLSLFQELLLEGYLLELEGNQRMSFFSYFTAMESFVTVQLEGFVQSLTSELQEPFERLPFDAKLRIYAKELLSTTDFSKVPVWSELSGKLKRLKSLRNDIAHAKGTTSNIAAQDVDDAFACACILFSLAPERTNWKPVYSYLLA
ncbi:hypothetical protein E2553_35980 [Paraburkholderia dipogonis]|uniref:Uncharacterized protein n=1 Tax=Paraburkholderia dipogonis TaxID=1211383 RepID=A0A4Y8MXE3_9BURK|nr:hypothetical protein [Paraburkholderia dipogonis]TFE42018.1 hypothetical protein E2553_35980 [Paraburkholderia dipogonis]